jgi:hypothetical protein
MPFFKSQRTNNGGAKPKEVAPEELSGYGGQEKDVADQYGNDKADYGYDDEYGGEHVPSPIRLTSGGACGDNYGYGEHESTPPTQRSAFGDKVPLSQLIVRRNSCLVHKDQDPLAVAEFLMGGPPRMSDRDLEAEKQQEVSA